MHDNYLFIDTETTTFPRSGLKAKGQARVCQLAMLLADNKGRILSEFHSLIKPTDWEIQSGAEGVHGISQQACEILGVEQSVAINLFLDMQSKAKTIVAHNVLFDKKMMEIECAYYRNNPLPPTEWYCTQKNSKDICKIPPTDKMKAVGRFNHKEPSLAEAYKFLTGKDIEGAHHAMVDVRACKEVFFHMKRLTN